MPRPQTPLAIAEATGALEHNPGRHKDRKESVQRDEPLGDPPNHFDDNQRDYWREVEGLVAPGVLCLSDRLLVETLVYLIELQRTRCISPVDRGHLRSCLGSMGLTPADRGRVIGKHAPQEKEDPTERFLARRGASKVN